MSGDIDRGQARTLPRHKLLLAALLVLGLGAAATLPLLVLHVTLQE